MSIIMQPMRKGSCGILFIALVHTLGRNYPMRCRVLQFQYLNKDRNLDQLQYRLSKRCIHLFTELPDSGNHFADDYKKYSIWMQKE
jgi:hypothetical protein